MKALAKIFLILPLSMLIGSSVQAQVTPGIQDTATIRQQKEKQETVREKTKGEAKNEVKAEVKAGDKTKNQTQARTSEKAQVKKVTSARPDMSKAKGARPGSIVRPAGSRLPKGVGRPGGAAGHGRR